MNAGPCLNAELAALMQQSLLPSRFPVRRDLEVDAGVCNDDAHVSFYDHLWLEPQVLAAVALRLHQSGLDGARSAAALRQLIRALLIKLAQPEVVLAWLEEHGKTLAFDAAVICVDVASGLVSMATSGAAKVTLTGGTTASAAQTLAPGDFVWLAAGEIYPLNGTRIPIDGLEALVGPALKQSSSGAGCAVLYKAASRPSTAATFTMANEQSGIPQLLEEVARFFSRQALFDDDVAGLDVALDEILTNIVNYGFRDATPHEIIVALTREAERLMIEIRDDGTPFDPLSLPEPDLSVDLDERRIGGLGIHFVRSLLDRVVYSRSNGWNVLTLEKRLPQDGRD